ncbi:chemosensory receptor a [Plakobranchus ocellatus]|uniref:Chemosensory receptor a n=1 Tax=Plakobranchus ocellatus TaxID=259542 RepID=A0AAV4CDX3_9GAST|nr:chemosensory receptor a [Plakobranchus ocellatus]
MDVLIHENREYLGRIGSSTTFRTSLATEMFIKQISAIRPIVSAEVYQAFFTFFTYANFFVVLVGIFSNILVIVAYSKLGFSETVNISYLALGISDLSVSVIRSWGAICFAFTLTNTNVPFDPVSLSSTTVFYPAQGFEKTTAFITAFIALERCLCVQFPLHVKTIVTRRKSIIVMLMIFLLVFVPSNLIHVVNIHRWIYSPTRNRTILVVVPLQTSLRYIIQRALYAYYGTILHLTALIAVWICTIFLAVGLKRKAEIRKENFKNSINAEKNKRKESHVIKTVFLLAITYLICSTPTAATLLVPHFVPEFSSLRGLARISRICHYASALLTQLNSSANLFIFAYMGSKFRQTLLALFGK